MVKEMASEYHNLLGDSMPETDTKDSSKMINVMGREFTILLKGIGMKVSSFLMLHMEKGYTIGETETGKKDNLEIKTVMERLSFTLAMDEKNIEFMRMARSLGLRDLVLY